MNKYTLILCFDGDICIVKDGIEEQKEVYHKSFNLGDNLKDNLLQAFTVYNNLTESIKSTRKRIYKVILYFNESYLSFSFFNYDNANLFLKFMLRRCDEILIAKILKGEDTIKVVSNIGNDY